MDEITEWCAVIVTGGLRLTLRQDIKCDKSDQYKHLLEIPSALLPVGGIPLLDHWIQSLSSAGIKSFTVVSNSTNNSELVLWAVSKGLPISTILNCRSTIASENPEILDLNYLFSEKSRDLIGRNLLFVQGDALIQSETKLENFISAIPVKFGAIAFDDYDSIDIDRRPSTEILQTDIPSVIVGGNGILPRNEVRRIRPQLYAYRKDSICHIQDFIKAVQDRTSNLSYDLQIMLDWLILIKGVSINAYKLEGILRTESLAGYRAAQATYLTSVALHVSTLPRSVAESCCARVGLMGNPSDGFHGRTLSFLIKNFKATVSIQEYSSKGTENVPDVASAQYRQIFLLPHPILDPSSFSDMAHLQLHTVNKGYYGGIRLLQATCKAFSDICTRAGVMTHIQRGFTMTYDTDIPRMVGLSGSSAIVVAAFRALMVYYGLSLELLHIAKHEFPQIILDIEKIELDIACGLQDRVVQTYGGLVHMDFTAGKHVYKEVDTSLLFPMYLAYNMHAGGESGKVHSTVRARWQEQDPVLVSGMKALGDLSDSALQCLRAKDPKGLAALIEQNFALRRALYTDPVVGAGNIQMVDLATSLGFAAKFTGSGGALLLLCKDAQGWLEESREAAASAAFQLHGFKFVRIEVA